jgi:Tfp pilus assembly protein PilF
MTRPGVADDLATVGVKSPFSITSIYVAGGNALKSWATTDVLQTDDRSALEFSGPRSIFGAARDDNATSLRELAASSPKPAAVTEAVAHASADDWRNRGLMLLKADAYRPAYIDLARAVEENPDDADAFDGLLRSAIAAGRMVEAEFLLKKLATGPDHPAAKLALSRLLASQGNMDAALRLPIGILDAHPDDVAALEQLASIYMDMGDAARLEPVAQRLVKVAPKSTWAHYYAASLFFLRNQPELAVRAARNAVAFDSTNAKAYNLIGAGLASMGNIDAARDAFEQSLKVDPREPGTYANLATLERQVGNRDRARRLFGEALLIDPSSEVARAGLNSLR